MSQKNFDILYRILLKKHFNQQYNINKCNNEYINKKLNYELNNINDKDSSIEISMYI